MMSLQNRNKQNSVKAPLFKSSINNPHWVKIRLAILLVLDSATLALAYWLSFALRLDAFEFGSFQKIFLETLLPLIISNLAVFFMFGIYRQIWRFANVYSAILIVKSTLVGTCVFLAQSLAREGQLAIPRSVPIIFTILSAAIIMLVRFSWRIWCSRNESLQAEAKKRCFIFGAGTAGALFANQISRNRKFPYSAVGFIDDDRNKVGRVLHGFKVLGTGRELNELAQKYNVSTVIITLHHATGKNIRHIVDLCLGAGLTPLILPDVASSLSLDVIQPRRIDIKDLLSRAPKSTDLEAIRGVFSGRTVLVTGAGGSIGSELCRQIAGLKPNRLVMLDASEYNLYRIELELREKGLCQNMELHAILGSTTDKRVVTRVFQQFSPHCVLHAAAYKHVPLVEANPLEGILNNILGTKYIAEAAIQFKSTHFLLISSDKAVRPTNVMGATKRACEMLVQSLHAATRTGCKFSSVRFGNVLGSSGSVVPRFLDQIQAGGPVTVTHPDVTRYFMLTSEAVALVLQSLALAKANDIFVLNMGEPVRIFDMAKQLILLAGKEPGRDVEITFTGLRPGEKLFEELILEGAEQKTIHDDVFIATPAQVKSEIVLEYIDQIVNLAYAGKDAAARAMLSKLIDPSKVGPPFSYVEEDVVVNVSEQIQVH